LAATLTELLCLFTMGVENMGFAILFILIAGFASIFSALRTMNSNINQQYDQNQKIIDLLKEIKEELRKR
jgi:uncharacterized membrane protein